MIHSGLYYPPGSLKAELCVSGGRLLRSYCEERSIPVEVCGKVVVAVDGSELPRLQNLFERGVSNGVPGLRLVNGSALSKLEAARRRRASHPLSFDGRRRLRGRHPLSC